MKNYQDRKFYQYQPYYKGTLHSINNSLTSNNMFSNKSRNKMPSLRLNSANNSLIKNKNKNLSQDKLKYFKANKYINTNNYLTIQNRSTSVKNHPNNFLYQKKNKNINFGQSLDLNYPNINISVSQNNNNILYQRKRQIIYEADNDLAEEYDKLRKIWKEAGVTDVYIDNFETVTNSKNNTKEEILQYLKNEETQMIKFREEMLKIVSEIIKRENDIKTIKDLNKKYLDIKTKLNINTIEEIKLNEYKKDKIKLEEEIERCLTYLRLHGINVVASFKKFNMRYDHLLNAGKVDLDFLKSKYGFDKNYLIKLKNDLDFLKDTEIGDLYQFNLKGKDPFLVNLSIEQNNTKYKILPMSEDMMKQIKLYNHLLNEVEIFSLMKNDYSMSNTFNFSNNNFSHTFRYGTFMNKNEESNFTNNIINSTPNTSKKFESKIMLNNNIKLKNKFQTKNELSKGKNKPIKLYLNTNNSMNNPREYENLKKNLTGPYYSQVENEKEKIEKDSDINNNAIKMPKIRSITNSMVEEENTEILEDDIIKEVETKVNKEVINKLYEVENRVKRQVEEKLKKDQERIKEEEKRLKKEKEKIEEIRRKEEEKRKKEKEKWEKKEKERIKREEEEKIKREEDEKMKKEENERYKKEIEEKFKKEIEDRFKKEEKERQRREQDNELIKRELELKIKNELEEERIKREREEKEKEEIKERIRIEEIENIRKGVRKEEYDRIKREEIDKIEKERIERMKQEKENEIFQLNEEKLIKKLAEIKKENEEKSKLVQLSEEEEEDENNSESS